MAKETLAPKVELVGLDDLTPYEGNPNGHGDRQVRAIAASLAEFGWMSPILADAAGVILAGEGRWRAARLMRERGTAIKDWPDLDLAPVIRKEGLGEDQRRAYVIADNQLARMSRWDKEKLARELQALAADEFDAQVTGLAAADIGRIMRSVEPAGPKPEVEFTPELMLEHNYVVLYFDNPLDWQVAVEKFGLKKVRDLIPREGQPVGVGRVVRGAEWLPRIN